jgi:tetratricopeptide (TPR) repeat protein
LKPELSLPKANLGVAYLFRPAGKDPGKAAQFLEEASQLAQRDSFLDPVSRLAEDINLAVAYAALGDPEKAMATLSEVETSLEKDESNSRGGDMALSNALAYNHAFLLAQSPDGQRQQLAIGELESYLRNTDSSLSWWQLAYQRYNTLCKQSGAVPKTENELLSQTTVRFRPVADLDVASGQIALGQNLIEVKRQLGADASSTPVVRGTNVVRVEYPKLGVAVIATDEVLAIVLCSDKASPLNIREMGLGTRSIRLQVGMSNSDLDRLLRDSDYDFRQLIEPDLNYRFYSDLGLAVLSQEGKIVELVISQIPKKRVGF